MTAKLGSLGQPRIGIALIWFVDAGASAEGASAEGSTPASVSPEDVQFVRGLTGLDPEGLVSRLQELAREYARDPEALRGEILRITDGDEIAAEYLVRLIHDAMPGGPSGKDDEPSSEAGRVIDFEHASARDDDDSSGGDGTEH